MSGSSWAGATITYSRVRTTSIVNANFTRIPTDLSCEVSVDYLRTPDLQVHALLK